MTDFGLAKAEDQQSLTQTGDIVGTLRYMAPEMFSGRADARSDVCELGLTLYEMLALRPAFDETDRAQLVRQVMNAQLPRVQTLDAHVPRDLATIVHKAIDHEPGRALSNGAELRDDLHRFLSDEPIKARRISLASRCRHWCRRNPAIAILTFSVFLLMMTIAVASGIAAVWFEDLAAHNAALAGERQEALGHAEAALNQEQEARRTATQQLFQSIWQASQSLEWPTRAASGHAGCRGEGGQADLAARVG